MVARGIGGTDVEVSPLQTILAQIGLSLLVAVTTALLTVWLSLRRFYREKWWEAKMQAYTNLIQALHHMKWDLQISIRSQWKGDDEETEYQKEWGAKHQAAWEEVRKQIDVGEFLYSSNSVKILRALDSETAPDEDEPYIDHLEKLQVAVEKCLPAIKVSARIDLGLPPIRG
jgi:hypothetical protein